MPDDLEAIKQALQRSEPVVVTSEGRVAPEASTLGRKARALKWYSWWDNAPRLLLTERDEMARSFPQFKPHLANGRLCFVGSIVSNLGYTYELVMVYPDDYPDSAIRVYPQIPDLKRVHQVHLWPDGAICFTASNSRLREKSGAELVSLSCIWVACAEQVFLGYPWPSAEASGPEDF